MFCLFTLYLNILKMKKYCNSRRAWHVHYQRKRLNFQLVEVETLDIFWFATKTIGIFDQTTVFFFLSFFSVVNFSYR